jgi:hypothetical protein
MENKFFATLFDLSFKSFVTRRVVGVLYVIWTGLLILFVVGLALSAIAAFWIGDTFTGFWRLLLVPITALGGLTLGRIAFEASVALVLIAENSQRIINLLADEKPSSAASQSGERG